MMSRSTFTTVSSSAVPFGTQFQTPPKRPIKSALLSDKEIATALFNPNFNPSTEERQLMARAYLQKANQVKTRQRWGNLILMLLALALGGTNVYHSVKQAELEGKQAEFEEKYQVKKPSPVPLKRNQIENQFEVIDFSPEELEKHSRLRGQLKTDMENPLINAVLAHTERLAQYAKKAVVKINTSDDSMGSGYFYRSDGIIVTNEHVVTDKQGNPLELTVYLLNGVHGKAKILTMDKDKDLALIQIFPEDFNVDEFPTLELSNVETLSGGTRVMAIGHPKGSWWSKTSGMISSNKRVTKAGVEHVQTDAAINSGNSGGPLVALNGDVVALNTLSKLDSDGLSYSITAKEVQAFIEKAIQTGELPEKLP